MAVTKAEMAEKDQGSLVLDDGRAFSKDNTYTKDVELSPTIVFV
jgi:hypothetical protein